LKKYELKFYPDPVLRNFALPVAGINKVIRHLISVMSIIVYSNQGIGLAAPQVGILKRVVIADIGERLISIINPEILTEFGEDFMEEGCLSISDTVVNVKNRLKN